MTDQPTNDLTIPVFAVADGKDKLTLYDRSNQTAGRWGEGSGRTAHTDLPEESHSGVVALEPA